MTTFSLYTKILHKNNDIHFTNDSQYLYK